MRAGSLWSREAELRGVRVNRVQFRRSCHWVSQKAGGGGFRVGGMGVRKGKGPPQNETSRGPAGLAPPPLGRQLPADQVCRPWGLPGAGGHTSEPQARWVEDRCAVPKVKARWLWRRKEGGGRGQAPRQPELRLRFLPSLPQGLRGWWRSTWRIRARPQVREGPRPAAASPPCPHPSPEPTRGEDMPPERRGHHRGLNEMATADPGPPPRRKQTLS